MAQTLDLQGRTFQVPDTATDNQVRQPQPSQPSAVAPRFNGIPVKGPRFGGIPVAPVPMTLEQQRALALARARQRKAAAEGSDQNYAEALSAGSEASQAFAGYTPPAPAEPSLIDHIMGGANYVGKTASIA